MNWVKRKTGPFATTVDDAAKLAELEKDHAVIIVGYFTSLDVGARVCECCYDTPEGLLAVHEAPGCAHDSIPRRACT